MNTLLKNLLILTFGVLTVNAASIATVDEQKVLSEYIAFNQAREKVLASVAPIQEEIQKMQEEITNIIAEAREVIRIGSLQYGSVNWELKLIKDLI